MSKPIRTPEADDFCDAVLSLRSRDECYRFFQDVCTVNEIAGLSQRFAVAKMLTQKKTYLEIAQKTGASTATISRVNRALTYGSDGTTIVGAKATAVEGGDSINISDCLDVDNGTLEITVEDPGTEEQAILVDIDGEVSTTGARTKVWDGVCALSAIENGCLLSKYNNIGKHLNTTADTAEANANKIMLWWPCTAAKLIRRPPPASSIGARLPGASPGW